MVLNPIYCGVLLIYIIVFCAFMLHYSIPMLAMDMTLVPKGQFKLKGNLELCDEVKPLPGFSPIPLGKPENKNNSIEKAKKSFQSFTPDQRRAIRMAEGRGEFAAKRDIKLLVWKDDEYKDKVAQQEEELAIASSPLRESFITKDVFDLLATSDPGVKKHLRLTCRWMNRKLLDPRVKEMRDICSDSSEWMIPKIYRDILLHNPESQQDIKAYNQECSKNNGALKEGLAFAVAIDDRYACQRFMDFRMRSLVQDNNPDKEYNLYQLYRENVLLSLSKNGSDAKVFNFLIKEDPWRCKNYYSCVARDGWCIIRGPIMLDIEKNIKDDKLATKKAALKVCQDNNCKTMETIWEEERLEEKQTKDKEIELAKIADQDRSSEQQKSWCNIF